MCVARHIDTPQLMAIEMIAGQCDRAGAAAATPGRSRTAGGPLAPEGFRREETRAR
jgi:hypothetical protein